MPTSVARRNGERVGLASTLAYVIGAVVGAVGVAMVLPLLVSVLSSEWRVVPGLAASAVITTGVGWAVWKLVGRPSRITTREGFAIVGLAWFVISAFGTLPFLLTGSITSLSDAYFETVSGFTTTGASVIPDPGSLPRGVLFWRALTQWLGGMGVIVLGVAVLPLLGAGGAQLARAEAPGHLPDRLTPRFQETAKRLWLLYAGLTAVQVLLLTLGDMDLFEAVTHAFTTMSTGGYGTRADSLAGFSRYTQWVVLVFMFLAGASFALHFRALRQPGAYLRSAEFRLYSLITLVAVVVVTGGLLRDFPVEQAIREGAFNAVSILTTTGFATADFGAWRPALQVFLVGLMFLGGMAGSTAGSVKTFRIGILGRAAVADVRRLVYPRGVFVVRFGQDRVGEETVEAIQSFFLFYMFFFMSGTFLLTFIDANLRESLDLITSASAVAASLGNIGPGLGEVGPAGNYLLLPWPGKWLLAGLMIVGRLEIFPVLLLFTRDLWRR